MNSSQSDWMHINGPVSLRDITTSGQAFFWLLRDMPETLRDKTAETLRDISPGQFGTRKVVVYTALPDGGLLVAASSLTRRHWSGSLCYYEDPQTAPDPERCTAGIELDSGVRDVCWVRGSDTVVAGCDSGKVSVWKLSEDHHSFDCVHRSVQHDSFVTAVSVNADQTRLTSSGQDCRIAIWDLSEFICTQTYTAHLDVVWAAAWHPRQKDTFISCSRDGRTILWDVRKQKPALVLNFPTSRATCVCWHSEHSVALGTQTGDVCIRDIRHIDTTSSPVVVAETRPHRRSVCRLAFCPNRPDWLASVSEDCTAVVTDFSGESPNIIYKDATSHADFITGVAWHPRQNDELYTCGWDYKISCGRMAPSASSLVNGEDVAMDCAVNCMGDNGDAVSPTKMAVHNVLLYSDAVKE